MGHIMSSRATAQQQMPFITRESTGAVFLRMIFERPGWGVLRGI